MGIQLIDKLKWAAIAPFLKKMSYSASRLALGILAGWLLKKGVLSAEDAPGFVAEVAPVIAALVWTAIETHKDLVLNNTLAAMPEHSTVGEAKALIAAGVQAPALVPEHKVPVLKDQQG